MKVYISADMEGLSGVVTEAQLGEDGFDYARACEIYTNEVLAVIEAAREVGAGEITVSDSHGNGQNLFVERMPSGVRLVRSWPRPAGMMEGIDDSFDAAVLLGYHTGSHNPRGVRAHSFSSAAIHTLRVNGQLVCEAQWSAFIAGHHGIPIVMISGDDALMDEIAPHLPRTEKVITKRAIAYHSAETLPPCDVNPALAAATERGLGRRSEIAPSTIDGKVTVDLTFKNHRPAEVAGYLPIIERTGSHSIQYAAGDIIEASGFLEFILGYRADLQP